MKYDSGYAWFVLVTAFMATSLIAGIFFSTTVFLVNFTEAFDISTSGAGWLCSVFTFLPTANCVFAGILIDKLGCRVVGFFGALSASVTLAIASQMTNMIMFTIMYSIVSGLLLSCLILPSVLIVQGYFDKYRAFATGFIMCGQSIGSFVVIPLVGYCIDHYGWRGAMMIVSGLLLNLCVCMLTFIPFQEDQPIQNVRTLTAKQDTVIESTIPMKDNPTLQWKLKSIITNFKYNLLLISYILFHFGSNIITMCSTPRAELDVGLDKIAASNMMSAVYIGGAVGRLFIAVAANVTWVNRTAVYASNMVISGGLAIAAAFIYTHSFIALNNAMYGIFYGVVQSLQVIVLLDMSDTSLLSCSQGLMLTLVSFTYLLAIPLSGWIHDYYGSFTIAFVIGGLLNLFGGFVAILLFFSAIRSSRNYENESDALRNKEKESLLSEKDGYYDTF